MKVLKYALLVLSGLFIAGSLSAQEPEKDAANWTYEIKKTGENKYDLICHLRLDKDYHIWSLNPGGDGFQYVATFSFEKNPMVKLIGKVREKGKKITGPMEGVDAPTVSYFSDNVDYTQSIEVTGNTEIRLKHKYQVCDDKHCQSPKSKNYSFKITDATSLVPDTNNVAQVPDDTNNSTDVASVPNSQPPATKDNEKSVQQEETPNVSWGSLFFKGLLSGLFAVITPCVFAMLPMNVSFFLKRSKTRAKGIMTAIQYSLSILLIFAIFGLLVSLLPRNVFNNLSTNWFLNLVFFVVFMLFGISFLGAFEINLPSSWATKMDKRANTSSFLGIFFLALTLVIVSFSCTVPFIGGLLFLVQSAGKLGPVVGFLGFGTGLALPFTLFAIFPTLLNEFGKSGGWLNAVKVVFGFIELALALKFLSNADLAMGWRLLDREIFIACWIAISFVLGAYLLGLIRFSHDSELPKNDWGLPYLKIPRLFFALSAIVFGFYLIPGMWGAPLNGMSAMLPPPGTQDFILTSGGGGGGNASVENPVRPVKYVDKLMVYEPLFVTQNGIESYFDYEEALKASAVLKRPVMLDFTGINCANCRKMESQVLSNPVVASILKEKFIIASLYCDYDKEDLPKEQQFYSNALKGDVETLGDYNEHIQASKFNSASQPYYFFVDEKGNKLIDNGYQYDPNVEQFIAHLNKVLENYKKTHP
jgi:thiol:disulfide interchange protein